MRQDKDRCGKWLLSHHGDAILKLAGVSGFTTWRLLSNEVVAPRRVLDGLLEVTFQEEASPTLVLVEIESYPGSDADRQVFDDVLLVTLEHGKVPEVLSLVLKPKGNVEVSGGQERVSQRGGTRLSGSWPVVRMWELDADDLLGGGDVGLVPWASLARTDKPPEQLLGECVARIKQVPNNVDRAGLMATTEILANLAFPKLLLPKIFGGPDMIIKAPILDEVRAILREQYEAEGRQKGLQEGLQEGRQEGRQEGMRDNIALILENRFGALPRPGTTELTSITDMDRLQHLLITATTCPDLDAFFAQVAATQPES